MNNYDFTFLYNFNLLTCFKINKIPKKRLRKGVSKVLLAAIEP